jgi:elongation factor G
MVDIATTECVERASGRRVPLDRVRNIGIMAHIDAGKTTLTERILYYTGVNRIMGEVHEGTATMDWMIQERERGITITSAATVCPWQDCQINIIDTPGHVDFTAEVERSLRVLDGAVAVFCAVAGVQPQSETVWRQSRRYGIPVIAFVNKMDRVGADFAAAVQAMRERLGGNAVPVQVPMGAEENFRGMIDLVGGEALWYDDDRPQHDIRRGPVPDDMLDQFLEAREYLVECLAEVDDVILERFLQDQEPRPAELNAAIRRAVVAGDMVPVLCGTAFRNKGVRPLLSAVCNWFPSPLDAYEITGINPLNGARVARHAGDDEPFAALAFKMSADEYYGRLAYLRVYSGTARSGMTVVNARTGRVERLLNLKQMHANFCEDCDEVFSGDIAAATGLSQDVITGDTLCAEDAPIMLDTMTFPEPVISMVLEPRSAEQRSNLFDALADLALEDPTFRVKTDPHTGQCVISGMGELHLDIIRDRLARSFNVNANAGQPQVSYRQTVAQTQTADTTFVRQAGAFRQFAHLVVTVIPADRGDGVEIQLDVNESTLPDEFREAVLTGLRETVEAGVDNSGHPLTDVIIRVLDASYDAADSSGIAFQAAAAMALNDAVRRAGTVLLEPVMTVEVMTPQDHLGDVIADLSSRHGRIAEVDSLALESTRIVAQVPLARLFGYATDLRSLTKGRADFVAEPSHYEPLHETEQRRK